MANSEKKEEYTAVQIKNKLRQYGTVYFPVDIKESIDDIKGNRFKKDRLDDFFNALTHYHKISELIKKTNLSPSLTVLLYGPPGTGKTALTRAFSKEYRIPICVVDSDRLVSSLLGDTIKNIRDVIEKAAEIADRNGAFVLFFDEIDAIGSERSNIHEVGEIKRAVISFLQAIDKINYEGKPLAIFGATNHQHQLDSAIWRRFTFHLQFNFPNIKLRREIIKSFINKIKMAGIKVDPNILTELDADFEYIQGIAGNLGINITEYESDYLWEELEKKNIIDGLLKLTYGYSGSDIERGTRVAVFKAIGQEKPFLDFSTFYESLKLVGGTAIHVERQDVLSRPEQDSSSQLSFDIDSNITTNEEFTEVLQKIIEFLDTQRDRIAQLKNTDPEYIEKKKKITEILNLTKNE